VNACTKCYAPKFLYIVPKTTMYRILVIFLLATGCSTAQNEIAEYSEHGVRFVRLDAGAVGQIQMVFKNEQGERYRSLNLSSTALEQGELLLFATNGGMFHVDRNPVGLFIEENEVRCELNTDEGSGNFFLKPNGVFAVSQSGQAVVITSEQWLTENPTSIKFATQSGPMLVMNSTIHPVFTEGSANKNIRSGVGVDQNGNVLFGLSEAPVNFHDFATAFLEEGCIDALYLDGAISLFHTPQRPEAGQFGVIIQVVGNSR